MIPFGAKIIKEGSKERKGSLTNRSAMSKNSTHPGQSNRDDVYQHPGDLLEGAGTQKRLFFGVNRCTNSSHHEHCSVNSITTIYAAWSWREVAKALDSVTQHLSPPNRPKLGHRTFVTGQSQAHRHKPRIHIPLTATRFHSHTTGRPAIFLEPLPISTSSSEQQICFVWPRC